MIFDLVLPLFNPLPMWKERLSQNINSLIRTYPEIKHQINSIIIVNDGSTKNVSKNDLNILDTMNIPCHIFGYSKNMGKGFALRHGVMHSNSSYCIYTDIDMPFGIKSIKAILEELKNGVDIATGYRNKKSYFQEAPFIRRIISKTLMKVNRSILNLPFEDTQAGIKGFNLVGKKLFLNTTINRFLFDLEFMMMAHNTKNIHVSSVEVMPANDLQLSNFKIKVLLQEIINLCRIIYQRKNYK